MHLNRSPTLILLTVVIGLLHDQLAFVDSLGRCTACETHVNGTQTTDPVDPRATCASSWQPGNEDKSIHGPFTWITNLCAPKPNSDAMPMCAAVQTRNTSLWSGGEYTIRLCLFTDVASNVDLSQLNTTGGACVDVQKILIQGKPYPARVCFCGDADSCNSRLDVSLKSPNNGQSSSVTPDGQPSDSSSKPTAPTTDATTKAPGSSIGLIVGIVVGCVLLIALIVAFVAYKKLSGGGDKAPVEEGGEEAQVSL